MLHPLRRPLEAGLAALVLALATAAPSSAAEPGTTADPAAAAAGWLAAELDAKDGLFTVTFPPDTSEYPDQGLTLDAILGLLAAGQGDDPTLDIALDALSDPLILMPYITGFETDADRAANATAKALFAELVSGVDVSDGIDLESGLRGLMAASGPDTGRFNDTDSLSFGNYANTIGQSLAVLALDRTGGGAPDEAVDFLLREQCPNGSFRLYHVEPAPADPPPATHACTDDAQGDTDATAFALMALLQASSSSQVDDAIERAIDHLLAQQQPSGGFLGTGAVNSNTTGLAASALRAAGETEAADDGAAFVAGLQNRSCAELGSLAYDQAAFAAGIAADRAQWTRATAQGVLALGLPDYGSIGKVDPVPAGLDDISCPALPGGTVPPTTVVDAAATAEGQNTIPATGSQAGELTALAVVLLMLGGTLVTAGRRRAGVRAS